MALQIPPGPHPSFVTTSLLATSIVFPILGTIAVALRLYAKYLKGQKLSPDDWVITAAQLCAWGVSISIFVQSGLTGVNHPKMDSFSTLMVYEHATWFEGFPRLTSLALVKIAILLFYARLFITPVFKIAVWVYIGILIAWDIGSCMALILVVSPITQIWNNPVPPASVTVRYDDFAFACAGISLFFDVAVLCFPLPVIRKLQMPWKLKLQVIGIFWVGIFCCIASAIRLHYLCSSVTANISTLTDVYQVAAPVFLWGIVEPNVSIVAACLPTYGPLLEGTRSAVSSAMTYSSSQKPITGARDPESLPLERADSFQRLWQGLDGRNPSYNIDIHATASPYDGPMAPPRVVHQIKVVRESIYSRDP